MPDALPDFIISVDLGQVADYTAVCVLERREKPVPNRLQAVLDWMGRAVEQRTTAGFYDVIHLERFALGTSYLDIAPRLHALDGHCRELWMQAVWDAEREAVYAGGHVTAHPARHDASVSLVADETGCGRPVLDLFRADGLNPLGVTITGGDAARWVSDTEAHVAKKQLASITQALVQSKRVEAASRLSDWPVLRAELNNFRPKITLSGNVTFEAGPAESWREGAHDDLVLALALGLWAGEELAKRSRGATFAEIAAAWQF
jgi:hypothetical protein